MKKESLFKPLDIIIYINIFMFIGGGIFGMKDTLGVSIFMITVGFINLVYLVLQMHFRHKYNKMSQELAESQASIEKEIEESGNDELNRAKQIVLERKIEGIIKHYFKEAKIIRNAYIPNKSGGYSEIDLLVLANKGIFVIETKNLSGTITGFWEDDMLKIDYKSGQTYDLYNPIKQNSKHFEDLNDLLKEKTNLFRNIVVFGDYSYLNIKGRMPRYAGVTKANNLIETLNKVAARYNTFLEQHHIDSLYDALMQFAQKTEKKEKEHLENIKNINN